MKIVAASHIHSEWSYDASWSLSELAHAFGKQGCDAVLMTEHDRGWDQEKWLEYQKACSAASTSDVLIVPGIEYSDRDNNVHVLVWGARDFLGEGLPTGNLLERVREVQASAVFAHPERRKAWEVFKDEWYEDLLGVEVWNRKTDGWAPSLKGIEAWNAHRCVPFASLDFHRKNQFHPLRMVVDVKELNGPESIFQALSAKRVEPTYKGKKLIGTLPGGGPRGTRQLEALRRVVRNIVPH